MISVITPTLNAAATLDRCIESVSGQRVQTEHLFIDGGSTDGTKAMLPEFIDAPGSGIYEAQNIGIRAASGDWVYFLGADDYVFPGAFRELQKRLDETQCQWVHFRIRIETEKAMSPKLLAAQQQAFMYRKSLLLDYGLMDESVGLCADVRFNQKLEAAGELCERIDQCVAVFSDIGHLKGRLNART